MDVVDCSSGILIPYYDFDTKIVFVAGKVILYSTHAIMTKPGFQYKLNKQIKGDGNIRYYEITDSEPYIHYLSEYKSSTPQRGLGFMPKRGLDVTKNEIFRFYKLHATGGICEPISMIVPRKSEMFQEDIYPDTLSGIPSISCDEWLTGVNRDPILISLKDGAIPFMPKIVTYKQMGYSELGNNFSRMSAAAGLGKPTRLANGSSKLHHHHSQHSHHNHHHHQNGHHDINSSTANNHKNEINGYTEITLVDSVKKINYTNWPHANGAADNEPNSLSLANKINGFEGIQQSTKLVLSSRSAFSKTSSSSSHSLSPPSSPNQNHHRASSSSKRSSQEKDSSSVAHMENNSSSNMNSGTNNTATSSNESVNQVMSGEDYLLKTVPALSKGLVSSNGLNGAKARNGINNKQLEELEASYITSMSRNPITLRKTESLKLESAQTMR
jgi:hypothetical protein